MDRQRRQQGFSFVEVIVAATILVIMVFAVGTLMISGSDAQDYAKRLNRATEITQDVLDDLRLELLSSVRLFGNDAEGLANLARLDLTGAPVPIDTIRLPVVSATGQIQKDTVGNEITGNSAFFARQTWTDRFVCSSSAEYAVDIYRWVYVYLTTEDAGPQTGSSVGLNLVRIVSEPLADGGQVDRITVVADQQEVLQHFANGTADASGVPHPVVEVVWLRGGDPAVAGTFRHIDGSSGTLSNTPLLPRSFPWTILRDSPEVTGVLSYRHHSIATIYAPPAMAVGRFGLVNTANDGWPHGLEFQIVGPSSARQVMIHLVLAGTTRRGQLAWCGLQQMVDVRDL